MSLDSVHLPLRVVETYTEKKIMVILAKQSW